VKIDIQYLTDFVMTLVITTVVLFLANLALKKFLNASDDQLLYCLALVYALGNAEEVAKDRRLRRLYKNSDNNVTK
jgi:hypothetical protein